MRTVLAITLTLVCAACAGGEGVRDGGVMTYDALAEVSKACTEKGGKLELSPGGDPQVMANYACKRK
jgi:hypothetical protein